MRDTVIVQLTVEIPTKYMYKLNKSDLRKKEIKLLGADWSFAETMCIDKMCPHCDQQVVIKTDFICPNCGEYILPCSICDKDVMNCEECDG